MDSIFTFLQKKGISIPDNSTPDTLVATKIKQLLIAEFDLSPDVVVNEASLLQDLDMYDLERIDFMAAWMEAFDIRSKALDEVVCPDGNKMNLMLYVKTVGEIIALTEWVVQQKKT